MNQWGDDRSETVWKTRRRSIPVAKRGGIFAPIGHKKAKRDAQESERQPGVRATNAMRIAALPGREPKLVADDLHGLDLCTCLFIRQKTC